MSKPTALSDQDLTADWGSEPVPASRVRYQVLAIACALAVVTYIQRIGFSVGAPEIKRSLSLDDAQVGYLMSAFLVAYGCFQVPGGLLGDRFGGRNVLTILVLGWSLLTGCRGPDRALAPCRGAAVRLPAGAPVSVRRVPGRRLPHAGPRHRRLDAGDRARIRAGGHLDVQSVGRCAHSVPAGLAVRNLRELAGPVRADRGARRDVVCRVLALVPQPAGGDAPGQSRQSGNSSRPADPSPRSCRDPCPGRGWSARSTSGRCA